jgi:hypothetical protein
MTLNDVLNKRFLIILRVKSRSCERKYIDTFISQIGRLSSQITSAFFITSRALVGTSEQRWSTQHGERDQYSFRSPNTELVRIEARKSSICRSLTRSKF